MTKNQHIKNAMEYLSKLAVVGDAVDLMALARSELRDALAEPEHEYTMEGVKSHAKTGAGNNANDHDDVQDD